MAVKTEIKEGLTVCYVDGEIDINSSPDIKKAFTKLITQKTPKVIINLSKVTYVDSSGLATLVDPPRSVDEMLHAADHLMYRAKERGKDRIESAQMSGLGAVAFTLRMAAGPSPIFIMP